MVPGLTIDPLISALSRHNGIDAVFAAHEAGAGFMADGSNIEACFGVFASTSGPGYANAMAPLMAAQFDQRPLLYISGDVTQAYSHLPAFHNSGEEFIPVLENSRSIVKYAVRIESPDIFGEQLQKAINIMLTPPYGPVHIQIPMDLFGAKLPTQISPIIKPKRNACFLPDLAQSSVWQSSRNPLLFLGHRAELLGKPLIDWINKQQLPVVTTTCSRGFVDESNSWCFGAAGFMGSEQGNQMLYNEKIDALVMIGASINERNLMGWDKALMDRPILHIDLEKSAVNKSYSTIEFIPFADVETTIKKQHQTHMPIFERQIAKHYLNDVQSLFGKNTPLFVDSGTSKALASRYGMSRSLHQIVMSGEIGSMGWGLCAAVGFSIHTQKPSIALVGDGSMRMLGQELSTAAQYQAKVVVLVYNNRRMAAVCNRFTANSHEIEYLQAASPDIDFAAYAQSLGVQSYTATQSEQIGKLIEQHLPLTAPLLIDIRITE